MVLKNIPLSALILAFIFLVLGAFSALAEEAVATETTAPPPTQELQSVLGNSPAQQKNVAPNPYPDIPDEYIQEAQKFFTKCENTAGMYQYYDCKCLSLKYLDKRIEKGPDAQTQNIALAISHECPDATIAAGYEYQKCLEHQTLMPKDITPEKYCTCYANTYAKLYESSKASPGSKTFVPLRARAYITCQDEHLAQKLYPTKIVAPSKLP